MRQELAKLGPEAPTLVKPSAAPTQALDATLKKSLSAIRRRTDSLGLDKDATYDVYVCKDGEHDQTIGKGYVGSKLLHRLATLAHAVSDLGVKEIADAHYLEWPETAELESGVSDRLEVGYAPNPSGNMDKVTVQFHANQRDSTARYSFQVFDLNDLHNRVEERVRAERSTLTFTRFCRMPMARSSKR